MPRLKIPREPSRANRRELFHELVTHVGLATGLYQGHGWRYVEIDYGEGGAMVGYDFETKSQYYLLEIDDPNMAAYFSLKFC